MDKVPDPVNAKTILPIFELFSDKLGKSYDYISYILFDPEKDGTIVNKIYSYTMTGKASFLNTEIIPLISDNYGNLSAPFIKAACISKPSVLYSAIRVEIQFPVLTMPLIIRVDYEQGSTKKLNFQKYLQLISEMHILGFHVNNSFFHVYPRKSMAATLDGGQIGSITTFGERQTIKKAVAHRQEECVNHLLDVFCANSMPYAVLNEDMRKQISNIVGAENVANVGDNFVFALPNMEDLTPAYRIKYLSHIKKLRRIFSQSKATI